MLLIQKSRNEGYRSWELTRQVEFALYNTTFVGMSGERPFKNIKKTTDLYRLPIDQVELAKVDKVQARGDVERMKQHFKWQSKKDSINTK